jgi:hypothetical protein
VDKFMVCGKKGKKNNNNKNNNKKRSKNSKDITMYTDGFPEDTGCVPVRIFVWIGSPMGTMILR